MTVNGAITTSFFRPPSDTRSKELLLLLPCDITSSSFLPCLVLPFLEILPRTLTPHPPWPGNIISHLGRSFIRLPAPCVARHHPMDVLLSYVHP